MLFKILGNVGGLCAGNNVQKPLCLSVLFLVPPRVSVAFCSSSVTLTSSNVETGTSVAEAGTSVGEEVLSFVPVIFFRSFLRSFPSG